MRLVFPGPLDPLPIASCRHYDTMVANKKTKMQINYHKIRSQNTLLAVAVADVTVTGVSFNDPARRVGMRYLYVLISYIEK